MINKTTASGNSWRVMVLMSILGLIITGNLSIIGFAQDSFVPDMNPKMFLEKSNMFTQNLFSNDP